ncbi:hypothetical protein BV20DRAFT_965331 [Pilatotrama ljubarskyi]|nr:hypothetical protein BV20DRAFT_965331 [Pilatotrama ljubarskyi]
MPEVTRIPTELWHEIITDACVDGGFTGRSLALASKFFHSQSLSARFRSIALDSVQKIQAFRSFLIQQPKDCKPKVENLYLATFDRSIDSPLSEFNEWDEAAATARASLKQLFYAATDALLTFAAPTVRTLCLVKVSIPFQVTAFPREMPKLEELSWMGAIRPLNAYGVRAPQDAAIQQSTAFPALKRVHFISERTVCL